MQSKMLIQRSSTTNAIRHLVLAVALAAGVLLTLLLPQEAHAGGWATVALVEQPEHVVAGKATTLVLEVMQHGQSPIDWESPALSAINTQTGERINATGVASEPVGRYTVTVAFPTAGAWSWAVTLSQLAVLDSTFPLFNVDEAGAVSGSLTGPPDAAVTDALAQDVAALQTTVENLQSDLRTAIADRDTLRTDLAALRRDADSTAQTTWWLLGGLVTISAVLLASIAAGVILLQRRRPAAEPATSLAASNTSNARWRAT